jgi:large subunit ribosomal protein L6
MSRIGKKIIQIPAGVELTVASASVEAKGPKGRLTQNLHSNIKAEITADGLVVALIDEKLKGASAIWGLYRSLLANLVAGVSAGFEKKLEINGVGFKAAASGKKLTLNVGFSHPVEFLLPEGVQATVEKNIITVTGMGKQEVGQVAANIRKIKQPEPYNGKGIKYVEEVIRRKVGKAAGKTA